MRGWGYGKTKQFTLDEEIHNIAAIEAKRLHGDVEWFQIRTTKDKRHLLRYDQQQDAWTLQGDYDGSELLARPSIELVTVDAAHIREAERQDSGL